VPDASVSTVVENSIFGACRNTAKNVCSVDDCIHFVYRLDSSFLVRWSFKKFLKVLKSVKFD